jgi:hypothetical protein
MEAKQAVVTAKQHLRDIYASAAEPIDPPTLEEIWFEPEEDVWHITLGLRRVTPTAAPNSAASRLGLVLPEYKVVRISDKDGRALSIRDRMAEATAR